MGTTLVNSSRSANAGKRDGGRKGKDEVRIEKRERRHEMVRGEII